MNNKQNNDEAFEKFMNLENNDRTKRLQIIHNENKDRKEYVPDEIPVFHQPPKKKSRNSSAFLIIIFTILAASMIGLLFGYGVLQMFIFIDQDDSAASTEINEVTKPASASSAEVIPYTLPQLSGYILQAGVFSEQSNAEEWQKSTLPDSMPSIIWEQDGQHFLFTGIFETEDIAKIKANETGDMALELYTKEWTTSKADLELTSDEADWLDKFHTTWSNTIMAKDRTAFSELIASIPNSTILEDLTNFISSPSTNNEEQFYLESMYLFNKLSKDVK